PDQGRRGQRPHGDDRRPERLHPGIEGAGVQRGEGAELMAVEQVDREKIRSPRGEDSERTVGFLTDATLCIGCKACQVACKQWNGLPGFPEESAERTRFEGGYDHTGQLSHEDWRHVSFAEIPLEAGGARWSFLSDVCK